MAVNSDQRVYLKHIFRCGSQSFNGVHCARQEIYDIFYKFIMDQFSNAICDEVLEMENHK